MKRTFDIKIDVMECVAIHTALKAYRSSLERHLRDEGDYDSVYADELKCTKKAMHQIANQFAEAGWKRSLLD